MTDSKLLPSALAVAIAAAASMVACSSGDTTGDATATGGGGNSGGVTAGGATGATTGAASTTGAATGTSGASGTSTGQSTASSNGSGTGPGATTGGTGSSSSTGATGSVATTGSTGSGATTNGGSDGGAASSASSGGSDGGVITTADGGTCYTWPNDQSSANSDPWLVEHHDQICEMHPRVLLLNYANQDQQGRPFDEARTQMLVDNHIAAWQWASRYHGYKDPNAKPFLNYELVKIVDLRDGGNTVTSTKLPTLGPNNTGEIDYAQLNSQAYADIIGIPDPDTGQNLTLCGLFEKGLINEVWGMVADNGTNGSGNGKFDESAENKVAYDANNQRVSPFKLINVSNGSNITKAIPCKVSVRIYDFNPTRGPGCHLHAAGHGWENYISRGALPAFAKVAATFFNFDFNTRFGASFRSFYDVCPYDNRVCINWVSNVHAASGPSASKAFDFADMSAGCGNVHFPPNATTQYTTAGDIEVQTSCENYGLHNGAGGKDLLTPYQDAIAASDFKGMGADTRNVLYDCGGTQPAYIFASMPGLGNTATAADGTPMKNWWVYYFY